LLLIIISGITFETEIEMSVETMMSPLLQKSKLGLANFLWNVEHVETVIGAPLSTNKKDSNVRD
jgi:hypothetical protein